MDQVNTISYSYKGDKKIAGLLKPFAYLQLQILRKAMEFQGLQQDVRKVFLNKDSYIEVSRRFGQESVYIYVEPEVPTVDETYQVEYIRYIAICLTAYDTGAMTSHPTGDWTKYSWVWHVPPLDWDDADTEDSTFPYAYAVEPVWTVWDAKLNQVAEILNATGDGYVIFPCLYKDIAHWFNWPVDPVPLNQATREDWMIWDYWTAGELPWGYGPFSDVDIGSCTPAELDRLSGYDYPYGGDDVYLDVQRYSGTVDTVPFVQCVRPHYLWRFGTINTWHTDDSTGLQVIDSIMYRWQYLYTPLGYFATVIGDYYKGKYFECNDSYNRLWWRSWVYQLQWIRTGTDNRETILYGEDIIDTLLPDTCKHSSTVAYQIYGYFKTYGVMEIDDGALGFNPCSDYDWEDALDADDWTHNTTIAWHAACDYDEAGEPKGMYNVAEKNPFTQSRNTAFEAALTALSNSLWSLNGRDANYPLIGIRMQLRHKPEVYQPS